MLWCEIFHSLCKHHVSELKPDCWRVCKYTNCSGVVRAAAEHVSEAKREIKIKLFLLFWRLQHQTFHVPFGCLMGAAATITLHLRVTPNSLNLILVAQSFFCIFLLYRIQVCHLNMTCIDLKIAQGHAELWMEELEVTSINTCSCFWALRLILCQCSFHLKFLICLYWYAHFTLIMDLFLYNKSLSNEPIVSQGDQPVWRKCIVVLLIVDALKEEMMSPTIKVVLVQSTGVFLQKQEIVFAAGIEPGSTQDTTTLKCK